MKKKILVVDDESSARFLLELLLKKEYSVETAFNTGSVLEKLMKIKFDLILLDINLGKSDSGINVLKRIREIDFYKNIPVMAVTAFALANDRNNFLNLGFNEYMAKPFERDELLSLIDKLLKMEPAAKDK